MIILTNVLIYLSGFIVVYYYSRFILKRLGRNLPWTWKDVRGCVILGIIGSWWLIPVLFIWNIIFIDEIWVMDKKDKSPPPKWL